MSQKVVAITDPNAFAIARELHTGKDRIQKDIRSLRERYKEEEFKMIEAYNKQAKEDIERLRFALCLPELINPHIDGQYLEFNMLFLHHGPKLDSDPMTAMLEKMFTDPTQQ